MLEWVNESVIPTLGIVTRILRFDGWTFLFEQVSWKRK